MSILITVFIEAFAVMEAAGDVSRYTNAAVTPIKAKGKVVGFNLSARLQSEKAAHGRVWLGILKSKDEHPLRGVKTPLYDKKHPVWVKSWEIEGVTKGAPRQVAFKVLYEDHPELVPGKKYQLATTWPLETNKDNPTEWKHSFGADWGQGWGEPEITLPVADETPVPPAK